MRSAAMIRRTKPISVNKLPDKPDCDRRYRAAMEEGSKALCQAILDTKKLHGPFDADPEQNSKLQVQAVEWAYDVKMIG